MKRFCEMTWLSVGMILIILAIAFYSQGKCLKLAGDKRLGRVIGGQSSTCWQCQSYPNQCTASQCYPNFKNPAQTLFYKATKAVPVACVQTATGWMSCTPGKTGPCWTILRCPNTSCTNCTNTGSSLDKTITCVLSTQGCP